MHNIQVTDAARAARRDFHDHSISIENLHLQVSRPGVRRPDIWRIVFHALLFGWIFLILVVDQLTRAFVGYSDLFMSAFLAMVIELAGCGIYLRWVKPRLRDEP